MQEYYIDDFTDRETYLNFVEYMLKKSDSFSLVYFRYNEREKLKKSAREIKKLLSPYKLFANNTNVWPSNITINDSNFIYRLEMYRSSPDAMKALSKADCFRDWDYPMLPMDLCFYKDGYAWVSSSAHENYMSVLTTDTEIINDLENLGAKLEYSSEYSESDKFYCKNTNSWIYWKLTQKDLDWIKEITKNSYDEPKVKNKIKTKFFNLQLKNFNCSMENIFRLLEESTSNELLTIIDFTPELSIVEAITNSERFSSTVILLEDPTFISVVALTSKDRLIQFMQDFPNCDYQNIFIADICDKYKITEALEKIYAYAYALTLVEDGLSNVTIQINFWNDEVNATFNQKKFNKNKQISKFREMFGGDCYVEEKDLL